MKTWIALFALLTSATALADTQISCVGAFEGEDQMYLSADASGNLKSVMILNLASYFGDMNGYEIPLNRTQVQIIPNSTRYELSIGSGYFLELENSVFTAGEGKAVLFNEMSQQLTYSCRK